MSRGGGKIILVFIFCCHAVGFLLFCKGFLLKRVVIPQYTKCTNAPSPHQPYPHLPSCNSYPRPFRRAVWLLIDALRYDFMTYDEELDSPPVYRNKMPFVRDLLKTKPANTRLFKFVADPPTTTMQRLKALTTGSLPTFIDIGSNFNSYAISEDSIPYQAKLNNRYITFIGDDTWLGLYPNMLTKTFDFPSLNVKDLDTVDNGVMDHLCPELAKNDTDILIGHMLGVDHVGHTYGPSHWTMGKKLTQMDNFLQHIFTSCLDEDTVMFVLGDHGMSPSGDHGGETDLEVNAALLVYSPRPLFNPLESPLGREVYQIDLVPTLSMVLGLPIPFSNLGMIIPEVLLPFNGTEKNDTENDGYSGRVTTEFLMALRINAEQIHNYLTTYAQYSGDFPMEKLTLFGESYRRAVALHQGILGKTGEVSMEDLTLVANEYVAYMKEVKRMCQSIWAKFDNSSITLGLCLLFLVVVISPFMLLDVGHAVSSLHCSIPTGLKTGLVMGGISMLFSKVDLSWQGLLSVLANFSLATLSSMIFIFLWSSRNIIIKSIYNLRNCLFGLNFVQLLAFALTALYSISMLSNSFILYEADMLAFFIQSITFCFAVRTLQRELEFSGQVSFSLLKKIGPHLLLMLCVRLSKLFYACRDLQLQDGCESTTFVLSLASASEFLGSLSIWRCLASSVGVILIPVILIVYLRRSKEHKFLSQYLIMAYELGFPISALCVVINWKIQNLPQTSLLSLDPWEHVTAPWIVYLTTIVIIVLCILCPFKLSLSTMSCEDLPVDKSPEMRLGSLTHRSVTAYQRYSKQVLNQRKSLRDHVESPVENLTGLDSSSLTRTLVITVICVFLVSFWLPTAMVLNDGIALSAILTAIEMLLAVRLLQNSEQGVSWEACVLWGMLSCHGFFSFGHHATVTSLRFEAAFVGIHGEITNYNLPLAGILVGLNTLASQFLFGIGFPLLLALGNRDHSNLSNKLLPSMSSYIIFHSFKLLMSVIAASLHRRHLMVWWVFAPRFLYEGAFQAVADICILLGYCLVDRLECVLLPT